MSEFAMLKGKARGGQINVAVPAEVEDAYKRIKREQKIDMPEEMRKAVIETIQRIERATRASSA